MIDTKQRKKDAGQEIGLVFGTLLLGVALYPLLHDGSLNHQVAVVAFFILLSALILPRVLSPLHSLWMKLAHGLSLVMTPLIMGIVFLTVITPIGIFMRLTGKDLLNLKRQSATKTMWKEKDPALSTGMDRQF